MMFGFRFRVNLSMDMSSNDMSSKDDKKVNEGVKYDLNSPAVTTHLSLLRRLSIGLQITVIIVSRHV